MCYYYSFMVWLNNLIPRWLEQALTSALCLYIGTSVLRLHLSGIFSVVSIRLKRFVNSETASTSSTFQTSMGISSGPVAFPFFILENAVLTSTSDIALTNPSLGSCSSTISAPFLLFSS
ncbi:hypothetical protein ACOME3_006999 [Neoechinorhynchus agilis]